jgi:hypothetical protein
MEKSGRISSGTKLRKYSLERGEIFILDEGGRGHKETILQEGSR